VHGSSGGPTRRYAALVVRWRWPVLGLVGLVTWLALALLPGVAGAGGGLSGILSTSGPAIRAQVEAVTRFGLPVLTRVAVVQRDPDGLEPGTIARAVGRAVDVSRAALTGDPPGEPDLLAAFPLVNTPYLVPNAGESNTTIVTYLFTDPTADLFAQNSAAYGYLGRLEPRDSPIGVAGAIPAQIEQGTVIGRELPVVETATLAAIAVIVGLHFRSVVAPLVTLVTAGTGYLLADRAIGGFAGALGVAAPGELEPIVVALMLGITTDYSIFFLTGMQRRLRLGESDRDATRGAIREYLPIVLTAGFIVACGVAALVVAEFGLFRELGPGLAVTVLVGLVVAVLLVPALMAVLGRWMFWPSRWPADLDPGSASGPAEAGGSVPRSRLIEFLLDRRRAAVVAAGVALLLALAASPLFALRAAVAPIDSLPADNPARVATEAAAAGFAPGILSPTEVIVSRPGIAGHRAELSALDTVLERQPGVTTVLSPNDQPLLEPLGLFLAPDRGAARYLIVFDSDPLGAAALDHLRTLRAAMPELLASVGLGGAEVAYAGDTAVGLGLVEQADADLGQVAFAVSLVSLVLLVLFLRALVAPLYLLVSNLLAVGAALGLTTLVFQVLGGADGLVFFVPFAAAVLLVALGSDYNVFSVGYIWAQARHRPLPEALAVAVPRSTRAISAAGLALAVSFALVALIPLASFQQLAFALAVGVLLDAFLVRAVLVPAVITLVGPVSGWPGRRLTGPGTTS
jgi:RND superfamily putative drug exporter